MIEDEIRSVRRELRSFKLRQTDAAIRTHCDILLGNLRRALERNGEFEPGFCEFVMRNVRSFESAVNPASGLSPHSKTVLGVILTRGDASGLGRG